MKCVDVVINAGVTPMKYEAGEAIALAPQSTKDERWRETLAQAEAAAKEKAEKDATVASAEKLNATQEIEITNLLEGKPQVFVNGEKLPLFLGKKMDVDHMIEEEEAENHPVET